MGRIIAASIIGSLLLLGACSEPASPPGVAALPPGWTEFAPGGETSCSDGTPYRFYARRATPTSCFIFPGRWRMLTSETCDPNGRPTYTVNIPDDYVPDEFIIFNFDNAENPFAQHSVVFAPYCTGDVHLGLDTRYACS